MTSPVTSRTGAGLTADHNECAYRKGAADTITDGLYLQLSDRKDSRHKFSGVQTDELTHLSVTWLMEVDLPSQLKAENNLSFRISSWFGNSTADDKSQPSHSSLTLKCLTALTLLSQSMCNDNISSFSTLMLCKITQCIFIVYQ